jgi:hypothetical protein
LGAEYCPPVSVVTVRATPLATSVTVTVAFATAPPLESVTIPLIRPKVWEWAGKDNNSPKHTPERVSTLFELTQLLMHRKKNNIVNTPSRAEDERILVLLVVECQANTFGVRG